VPGVSAVVADLVKLLANTKSKEMYLATVLALAQMGDEARAALPAVLEHGERLGMFKGICDADAAKRIPGNRILEAVAKIAGGERYPVPAVHDSFPVPSTPGYVPPPPGATPTMPGRVLDGRW
jgi:hypothetical protein